MSQPLIVRVDPLGDAESAEPLLRQLGEELRAGDAEVELSRCAPPAGAKADLGIAEVLAVSLSSGSAAVVSRLLCDWVQARRQLCSVFVERSDGASITIANVRPDRVAEVLTQWQREDAPTEDTGGA